MLFPVLPKPNFWPRVPFFLGHVAKKQAFRQLIFWFQIVVFSRVIFVWSLHLFTSFYLSFLLNLTSTFFKILDNMIKFELSHANLV
jgi:hypothetical protein